MIKREIIYPIFLHCCQFTNDIFWQNIFEELAYGKTSFGIYISKNFICCNQKKKEFSYKIENKEPQIIFNEIYNIFKNKVGLQSHQEKLINRKAFNQMEDENNKNTKNNWGSIKKKNMKELLIELYVTKMKNKHFLTLEQSRYLISIIYIGIIFKVISKKDINYINGEIINIDGIEFDRKKVILKKDIYSVEIMIDNQNETHRKTMADVWNRYIKDLKKLSFKSDGEDIETKNDIDDDELETKNDIDI
jgi:hypothetical protein